MSSQVVPFGPRHSGNRATGGFTPAELERALAIVHAAVEEYRKDYRSARLHDKDIVMLLDRFGRCLAGREYLPPDELAPEHAQ